ncbi:hypothetical protein PCANC_26227 [Puccinia coronata f. sp. avenae]|uniref:Uncharacterized protein n=1 Tax=Puccinia coronata f. sp. avenae TaxID=200324 RepID=A0A2N5S5N3_9BASI|nr:hypothetical protein PCANC_26227 [Puccinia coronata f. sp. avenae]
MLALTGSQQLEPHHLAVIAVETNLAEEGLPESNDEFIARVGDNSAQQLLAKDHKSLGVQTPARPPPHAARRPHAYKWREDGRLGVRPRRTGVLAMHACPARLT